MPIYEYRCNDCNEITDAYRRVAARNAAPDCDRCGGETKKIISAYRTHGDIDPYYDENLECHIESKAHRRRVMKQQGVEEHYGQNWYTSAVKTRKA